MTNTIRELILRVLDCVARTPGAYFTIASWDIGDDPVHYISRDGDEYWSQLVVLDKYNLRYLVKQLEG